MKTLVVDDVGYIRHFLQTLLQQHGHGVATARNGVDALDLLKTDQSIQVVLTDLLMPGMSGIDLYKAAQKLDRFDDNGTLPPLTFYLMTALRPPSNTAPNSNSTTLQHALDIGFAEIFHKPVDSPLLLQRLADLNRAAKGFADGTAKSSSTETLTALLAGLVKAFDQILAAGNLEMLAKLHQAIQSRLPAVEQSLQKKASLPVPAEPQLGQLLDQIKQLTALVNPNADSQTLMSVTGQIESHLQQFKNSLQPTPA